MKRNRNLNSVMEIGDHFKNGASLKSQTSKKEFFIMPLLIFTLLFNSCRIDLSESTIVVSTWKVYEFNPQGETVEAMPVASSVKINLTVTSYPEWVTVETKGEVLHITASKNESSLLRVGNINYSYSGSKKCLFSESSVFGAGNIAVSQKGIEPN